MTEAAIEVHVRSTVKQEEPARLDYSDRSAQVKMLSPWAWQGDGS